MLCDVRLQVAKLRITSTEEKKEKNKIVKYLRELPGPNFLFLYNISKNVDLKFLKDLIGELSTKKYR